MPRSVAIAYRLIVSAAVLFAVIYQFSQGIGDANFNAVDFFSFFTILSNLIGAAAMVVCAVAPQRAERGDFDLLRGAATLYLAITGLVFSLLLSGITAELGTVIPWVNTIVHYVMPIAIVIDWLLNPPAKELSFAQTRWWLVFPIVYLVYSLIRGPFVDWYPYPFLDHDHVGSWWGVAAYCVAIALVFVAFTYALTWLGNALGERRRRTAPSGAA